MFTLGCASVGNYRADRATAAYPSALEGRELEVTRHQSSLLGALPALTRRLPEDLVTEADRKRIARILADVKGSSVGCFECRLGGRALGTDFHTFHHPEALTGALARFSEERCSRILRRCHAAPDAPDARDEVPGAVIFEFDAHADGGAGAPSVFFSLYPSFGGSPARVLSLVHEQLGECAFDEVSAGVARVLAALPEGATIGQIGFMLGRTPARVRLNIDAITAHGVATLLRKLDWPGDVSALCDKLTTLAGACDGFQLGLDVGAELDTKLGIECFIGSPSAGGHDWDALLDFLRSSSLCSESEAQAILAWPGFHDVSQLPSASPLARFLGPRTFLCRINHVKVVFDGGRARQAKAYLLFAEQRRGAQ